MWQSKTVRDFDQHCTRHTGKYEVWISIPACRIFNCLDIDKEFHDSLGNFIRVKCDILLLAHCFLTLVYLKIQLTCGNKLWALSVFHWMQNISGLLLYVMDCIEILFCSIWRADCGHILSALQQCLLLGKCSSSSPLLQFLGWPSMYKRGYTLGRMHVSCWPSLCSIKDIR